jgi:hypothetical protein
MKYRPSHIAWLLGISLWVLFGGIGHGSEVWKQPRTPAIQAQDLNVTGLSAKDCGVCHTEIYGEWAQSVHAAAWVDPQFQAELHKDPGVGWLCLNCHTPLTNQQQWLVTEPGIIREPDVVTNPTFDGDLQSEGVTCLSCHWTENGIASVHSDVNAPHKTVYTPSLKTDAACTSCHQAKARLEDALVCHFNTGDEKSDAGIEGACSSCHMPRVERSMAVGAPVRTGGRHLWPGSGLGKGVGPAVPGLDGLDVALGDAVIDAGGDVRFSFSLQNARAGHKLPTGDPERFLRVVASIHLADGTELDRREWRIGQVWEWSPVAKQLSDNRLTPGETRSLEWHTAQTASPSEVRLVVEHVRLSDKNRQYHVELAQQGHPGPSVEALEQYPGKRTVFSSSWPLQVVTR